MKITSKMVEYKCLYLIFLEWNLEDVKNWSTTMFENSYKRMIVHGSYDAHYKIPVGCMCVPIATTP